MDYSRPSMSSYVDHTHYTLSSYDPVSIELFVPYISEQDVDDAVAYAIRSMGGGPDRLYDDEWIREQFPGISNASEMRDSLRLKLQSERSEYMEKQKSVECAEALASRLMQKVPYPRVKASRSTVHQYLLYQLNEQGLTEAKYLEQSGMTREDMDEYLDVQAEKVTRQEAALNAWAEHYGIGISNDEIPQFLNFDQQGMEQTMQMISAYGQLEQARQTALRAKVLQMIIGESVCSYRYETPAERSKRKAEKPGIQLS